MHCGKDKFSQANKGFHWRVLNCTFVEEMFEGKQVIITWNDAVEGLGIHSEGISMSSEDSEECKVLECFPVALPTS